MCWLLKNGLPEVDDQTPAKYAMAQPFVPAFCLACSGTSNAEHVLLRWWKYIHKECESRKIKVIRFGGDGDSRIMKAMRVSTGLFSKHILQETLLSPVQQVSYPTIWSEWFWMQRPSNCTRYCTFSGEA